MLSPSIHRRRSVCLAKDHLQYGYPCIWNHKTVAERECRQKIDEMKKTYVQIENRIKTTVEKDIGTIGNRLVRKSTDYVPKSASQSFYYDNLVPLIYLEILSHSEDNPPTSVNVGYEFPRLLDENGKEYIIALNPLSIGGMKVAVGKESLELKTQLELE